MGVFEDTKVMLLELWHPMTQSPACYVIPAVAVFCLLLQLGTEALARPMYLKRPGYTSEKANTSTEDAAVRVVGLVFAVYAATNSTVILATTSPANWTQFYLYEPRAESLMHVASGFFLWDLYSCLTSAWGGFFTAHAAVSLFVFAASLRPFLHHIGCVFLMYEASTVFMHLRHFAMELNWSATIPGVYDALSIAFATMFFIARILIGLPISVYWWWHMIAYIMRGEAHSVPVYVGYLFANAVITGLNIMWFSKIVSLVSRAIGRAMKGTKTAGSLLSPDALGVDEKTA
ncbi:hypothetical protein FNF27_06284 [Cafeteria roenbergensis]|nr:hypothetical protein FNF31_00978 [Cafeteria roenbergensis]KAA0171574.1 hypothetical protein FNF27_06284 [Cafeteria roenbergensis]